MKYIQETKINESLKEFLSTEGVVDRCDGEICGDVVITRDTFEDYKSGGASFKGVESHKFDGQKLEILRNFQARAGDTRKSLFHVNFGDDSQNLVFIF